MNAKTCVPHNDVTSMDSYYSQGRDHQTEHLRTFPATDAKYSPFLSTKGQAYGERSRSPFQQECQSLDAAAGPGSFSKYHLFTHSSARKTPPEEDKLQQDRGHDAAHVPCYGGYKKKEFVKKRNSLRAEQQL